MINTGNEIGAAPEDVLYELEIEAEYDQETKRATSYLRSILIHGARSVIRTAKMKDDRLSQWVTSLAERRHPNVAAVALANKTARIAWAMLRYDMDYDPDYIAA